MQNQNDKMLVEYKSQGGIDIRLTPTMVTNYLVQGKRELVTAQEIVYFMHVCKARKLNPFIKDCYLIKYGSEAAAIVTSVDYFRKNARKATDCKGWKDGIIIQTKDGAIEYREGSLILPDEILVGGWAEAQPEGWNTPKRHTINLEPYIKKTKDGRVTKFWQPAKQPDMINKVAECQLLRKLWGEESTGMYSPEEMPSLEDIKMDGPVQSSVKQRIMDGEKKQDKPIIEHDIIDHSVNGETTTDDKIDPPDKSAEKIQKSADHVAAGPIRTQMDEQVITDTFFALCKSINFDLMGAKAFVDHMAKATGAFKVDIMDAINKDPKREFEIMTVWLKSNPVEDKPAETGPPLSEKPKRGKFGSMDIPFNSEEWNPKNWSKIRRAGFSTYIWKHINMMSGEPKALQEAVLEKWNRFYPGDIFPTTGGQNNGEDTGHIETETFYDPEEGNNADLQNEPDKGDVRAYNKWLRNAFPEEIEAARQYLGFTDTPKSLSDQAIERWNTATMHLIDS